MTLAFVVLFVILLVVISTVALAPVFADENPALMSVKPNGVMVKRFGSVVSLSVKCPRFIFDSGEAEGGLQPETVQFKQEDGRPVEISYPSINLPGQGNLDVKVLIEWSPAESVLRKWARFRVIGTNKPYLLKEIILESLDTATQPVLNYSKQAVGQDMTTQSYPVFMDGAFAGIEFPIASTRAENGKVLIAHRPGLSLKPGEWYESRKSVFGICPKGRERESFKYYIASHRPTPRGFHINYNSWWTSPVPYSEQDILKLMRAFEEKLYKPYGVSFDTFCIDMGWSEPRSFWNINEKLFPERFARIQQGVKKMNSSLGLWVSPSNCYSPNSMDNEWAKENGYETFLGPGWGQSSFRYACLGGKKYQTGFRDRLVEMAVKYGVRHFKFDGYRPECPESDHGHAAGESSREAVADGVIDVFKAIRKAAPDTWIETTCFGWDPSPWWLFHVNSVIGTYGDDAPYGRVPCPIYRQSYTTARDYYNLQGTYHLPIPPAAQEVLGIVHQTQDDFTDDAVMTIMRGHMFLPAYINPAYMNDSRWKSLAVILKWGKKNASLLQQTVPLLPKSWQNGNCPRFAEDSTMPAEPYGYAHWGDNRGLIVLRNPSIRRQTYKLSVDLEKQTKDLSVLSIYPERRLYEGNLSADKDIDIPLAPYETLVLSIGEHPKAQLASVENLPEIKTHLNVRETKITNVSFEGNNVPYGPDYTSLAGSAESGTELKLDFEVNVKDPQASLLVLIEGQAPLSLTSTKIQVNKKGAKTILSGSETGWAASGLSKKEHWLFVQAPLEPGKNDVTAELLISDKFDRISAWIWGTKPGKAVKVLEGLPQPEMISLGTTKLMEESKAVGTVSRPRPVEKIDGVYLDSLEPLSVTQGWGTLQKNQSVWEKPMAISGQRFLRGLGTHAPSKIIYNLDGKYSKFQTWAGADNANAPSVTFEVWVDGRKKWESGLMTRADQARFADIDVTGAKKLELIVGDGGNGIVGDHADWADAKLIK